MRQITAIVEISDNNLSAYLEGIDGVIAVGHDLPEIKKSMEKSISLFIETCKEYGMEVPTKLCGDYEIAYKYDMCSFLNAYSKILSKSGLEALTGVNQKQLWHYANGISKPKRATVEKVASAIHSFGKELAAVEFA